MSKYNPSAPPPTPCTPHPSLAPYADQLDHWHKTEILLLRQTHDLLRPLLSLPLSAPSSAPLSAPLPAPLPAPLLTRLSAPSSVPLSAPLSPPLSAPSRNAPTLQTLPTLLPLLTLLTLLPLLTLQPLPACQKLLLKQAQLVIKASRPAEPRASPPQDDPEDYSKAIALMRREYFADVDEYERSGLLKIPPLPDPCGAGILPASPAASNPPCLPPS